MLRFPKKGEGTSMKSVVELLRELREDNDLSQSEVASVLGISQQYYSSYENGDHELPLRHFIKLADYYNVSGDYLMGRCALNEKSPLATVHITRDCTGEQLLENILSLNEKSRQSVVEYVELQKLKKQLGR